jgi:uncharacterized phage protein gp47/JayE
MTTRGLTTAGFVSATLEDLLTEIVADELANIDPNLDTDPDQFIGQINAIFAKKLTELWELAQTVVDAFDDTSAEGALLAALGALTGSTPEAAAPGAVIVNCALVSGTVLGSTSRVSDPANPANRWTIDPTIAPYTATATATIGLRFLCDIDGPFPALAGSLTHIDTPVSGWTTATNPADATEGTNLESDVDFRIRRRAELAGQGRSNPPALESALYAVTGVQTGGVFVVQNLTNANDSDGRPPHSFEALIFDGVTPLAADSDIRAAIFANSVPGIQSFGSNSGTVTDKYGNAHVINFSRLSQVPVTVTYTVLTDPTKFPSDGVAQIKAALVALQATATRGGSVIFIRTESIPLLVAGVIDVTACTQAAPGHSADGTNIVVDSRSIATYDTSRIAVTVTP